MGSSNPEAHQKHNNGEIKWIHFSAFPYVPPLRGVERIKCCPVDKDKSQICCWLVKLSPEICSHRESLCANVFTRLYIDIWLHLMIWNKSANRWSSILLQIVSWQSGPPIFRHYHILCYYYILYSRMYFTNKAITLHFCHWVVTKYKSFFL